MAMRNTRIRAAQATPYARRQLLEIETEIQSPRPLFKMNVNAHLMQGNPYTSP